MGTPDVDSFSALMVNFFRKLSDKPGVSVSFITNRSCFFPDLDKEFIYNAAQTDVCIA